MAGMNDWTCRIDDIGPDGYLATRQATTDERAALAGELDLVALERLAAEVAVKASGGSGRYKLTGRLKADLIQSCVVTLEPIESSIDEPFEIDFWPPEQIGPLSEGEHSVLEADVPEPIENGRIDIGRMVYETLASAIDPFPRKPDAALDPGALVAGEAEDKPESPFAVLAKLKKP